MKHKLLNLANSLSHLDRNASDHIHKLSARYDKASSSLPIKLQPAFKYIMYLKLFRNVDDETFHKMKRKYINTDSQVQNECQQELDKLVSEDARTQQIPTSTVRLNFEKALRDFIRDYWSDYFELELGKR